MKLFGRRRRRSRRHPELFDGFEIGRHTYGITEETIMAARDVKGLIRIGAFCSIAPGVRIIALADHPLTFASTYPFRTIFQRPKVNLDAVSRGRVTIGNDVWIGYNAIILSGVTIGDGAVVGAGAVVARDIPPYGIAVGNPASVIRYRFSPEQIAELLTIRWWDWPDDRILALDKDFYGSIDQFIEQAGRTNRTDM